MATLIKLGLGIGLISFGASYLDIVRDLFTTVRVSVTGLELSRIDEALQREGISALDADTDLFPKTQDEFEQFLSKSFEDRGRDVTLDQFGNKILYQHPGRETYHIASAGPDKEYGTSDDVLLSRHGKKRRVTHSPKDIEKLMEKEIEKASQGEMSVDSLQNTGFNVNLPPKAPRGFGQSRGSTEAPEMPKQPSKPKTGSSKGLKGLGAGKKP